MRKNHLNAIRITLSLLLLFFLQLQRISAQLSFCPPNQPAFAECEFINCVVCNLNGQTGMTAGFGPDPDNDLAPDFCSTVESVQYIQFFAAMSDMTITVTTSGCTVNSGIDLGIMPQCDYPLDFCTPGNGTNVTSITASGLSPGQDYVLIIDADVVGNCSYVVTVDPPDATNAYPLIPPNVTIAGDFEACPHELLEIGVVPNNIPGAIYAWTGPAGILIDGQTLPYITPNPNVTVEWGTAGGVLCVNIRAGCDDPVTVCHPVTMTVLPPTYLPPVTLCSGADPYPLPWGGEALTSGFYSGVLTSEEGCDSTVIQQVIFVPEIVHNLNTVYVCEGDCFTVCGESFCDYGDFSKVCQAFSGCDSTVIFSLAPPNLTADIQGDRVLTCAVQQLTLTAATTLGTKSWFDPAGNLIGNDYQISVNAPGAYALQVAYWTGTSWCIKTDTIHIIRDVAAPGVTGEGATVGCDTVPVFVHATSAANPVQYAWTGPNGFSSMAQNPQVMDDGTYFVTATNPANGCTSLDTVIVKRCCFTDAGHMDSLGVSVCGAKDIVAVFYGDQSLTAGDSLVFFLYSDPANPLGSMLMSMPTPVFPFIAGTVQYDSVYYVAAVAGHVLPDHSIDWSNPCLSVSTGEPVRWWPRPVISLQAAPNAVCRGECMDVVFQFQGLPPFQFHLEITQNGQPVYAQNLNSDLAQKTFTFCPADFLQLPGPGDLYFMVDFLMDARCDCGD